MPYDRAALLALLDARGYVFEVQEHEAVATVDEARRKGHDLPGAHTKNLFVKDKKGGTFLVSVPAEARVDLKRLHEAIGARGRLSFASAERLLELLGVRPGSVTLFGAINDEGGAVRVVLDEAIADAETICAHPLENTATVAIAQRDMLDFLARCDHEPLIVAVPRASA